LRRPSFKKYFTSDSDHALGLMDVLNLIESGKTPKSYEGYFQNFGNEDDCIEWIGSGSIPTNPAEKLDSAAMNTFIAGLKKEYDIVIVDTPPALPVTDAAVLSAKVDSVLVVARAGVTKQTHVAGVFEILDNLRAKTLGVVLNMVPQHARGEEYGYAYNRYVPKSKYGYSYDYGYGTTEPYGPLVLQSNLPATGEMRVPLEVRLKAKLANRKKVKATKPVDVVIPEIKATQTESEFEKLLAEIKRNS
jgi:Mrp family chromosome partitioning ATPase